MWLSVGISWTHQTSSSPCIIPCGHAVRVVHNQLVPAASLACTCCRFGVPDLKHIIAHASWAPPQPHAPWAQPQSPIWGSTWAQPQTRNPVPALRHLRAASTRLGQLLCTSITSRPCKTCSAEEAQRTPFWVAAFGGLLAITPDGCCSSTGGCVPGVRWQVGLTPGGACRSGWLGALKRG